jgi:iron complex transport system substrate-binding protein
VGRAQAPYPKVSVEEVLRQDPEVILFPVGATEGIPEAEQQFWRRWTNLSAVAHNRLHQIRGELINRPGPRVIDGTELMARYLHPDLFPPTGGAKAR